MNNEENKYLIFIPLILYTVLIPIYIYAYIKSSDIFWVAFIIERVISYFYGEKLVKLLLCICNQDKFELGIISGFVLLCIASLAVIIYVILNYIRLFIILLIGKIIDITFNKIANILIQDENIGNLK